MPEMGIDLRFHTGYVGQNSSQNTLRPWSKAVDHVPGYSAWRECQTHHSRRRAVSARYRTEERGRSRVAVSLGPASIRLTDLSVTKPAEPVRRTGRSAPSCTKTFRR